MIIPACYLNGWSTEDIEMNEVHEVVMHYAWQRLDKAGYHDQRIFEAITTQCEYAADRDSKYSRSEPQWLKVFVNRLSDMVEAFATLRLHTTVIRRGR